MAKIRLNIVTTAPMGTLGDPMMCHRLIHALLQAYDNFISIYMTVLPPYGNNQNKIQSIFTDLENQIQCLIDPEVLPVVDKIIVTPLPFMLLEADFERLFASLASGRKQDVLLISNFNTLDGTIRNHRFRRFEQVKDCLLMKLGFNLGTPLAPFLSIRQAYQKLERYQHLQADGLILDWDDFKPTNQFISQTTAIQRLQSLAPGLHEQLFSCLPTEQTLVFFSYINLVDKRPYTPFILSLFCKLCTQQAKRHQKNICLISNCTDMATLSKYFDKNECTIELQANNHIERWGQGRQLIKVVCPFPLDKKIMQLLHQISAPLTLQTGNSSIFEALANHKITFYQVTSWSLGFWQAFFQEVKQMAVLDQYQESYYAKVLHLFANINLDAAQLEKNPNHKVVLTQQINQHMDLLNRLLMTHQKEIQAELKRFHQWLVDTYHNNQIIQKIGAFLNLLQHVPETVSVCEPELQRAIYPEDFLNKFKDFFGEIDSTAGILAALEHAMQQEYTEVIDYLLELVKKLNRPALAQSELVAKAHQLMIN